MVGSSSRDAAPNNFPPTRYSALLAVRDSDPAIRQRAMDAICAIYWKPVYSYLRLKWRADPESAADWTQEFFLETMEKDVLSGYNAGKARFRTFLRVCLDRFVQKRLRSAQCLKRGGGLEIIPLDFAGAESELATVAGSGMDSPDVVFDREWIRSLLATAVAALHRECMAAGRETHFRLFARCDLKPVETGESVSYAELARQHGLTVDAVNNHLAFARRRFRQIVLDQIRLLTASEEEFREEVRAVLGIEPS